MSIDPGDVREGSDHEPLGPTFEDDDIPESESSAFWADEDPDPAERMSDEESD